MVDLPAGEITPRDVDVYRRRAELGLAGCDGVGLSLRIERESWVISSSPLCMVSI
jgi:hypothetical protein